MEVAPMHGYLCNTFDWPNPIRVVTCEKEARPGYAVVPAHEYNEANEEVLLNKVRLLAQMMLQSNNCVAYTGAGISTGAGIGDYASRSAGTTSQVHHLVSHSTTSSLDARPTMAHHVLTRLYQCGILKWWCQQNHDGLPQKAGFPQHALNEIHGSWFDPANRVVKMSENLRSDLHDNMIGWQHQADVCLAIGTSLSGMAADEIVTIVSRNTKKRFTRFLKSANNNNNTEQMEKIMTFQDLGAFGGAVIIGFQCTSHDHEAALHIYHSIDTVFHALITVLIEETPISCHLQPRIVNIFSQPFVDDPAYWQRQVIIGKVFPWGSRIHSLTLFQLNGYHARSGKRSNNVTTDIVYLNLSPGQVLVLTGGVEKGCQGIVASMPDSEGNICITWRVPKPATLKKDSSKDDDGKKKTIVLKPITRVLGIWNIISALEGLLPMLPCLNVEETHSPPTLVVSSTTITRSRKQQKSAT